MNINNLSQYDNVQSYVKTRCKQRSDVNTKRINKHSKFNRKAMRDTKRQHWEQ